jgi:uncharacterized Zn-binding protein involved in type VI secretion
MNPICAVGDMNNGGGVIISGAATVFANFRPVGLAFTSLLTPHPSFSPKHLKSTVLIGSPSVICEGRPVARVTSACTCWHVMITGAPNILVM